MADYPPIAEHGLIGNLQTAALVATDGTIDWFCAPRFDSPSVFGALLDHRRGGYCRVRPSTDVLTTRQLYFPDSAALVTRFLTEAGVGEVVDFMPVCPGRTPTDRHRIIRLVRCVRGRINFAFTIAPRFDYGREPHETHLADHGAVFQGKQTALTAHLDLQEAVHIGHSTGGGEVARYIGRHGTRRVARAVLMGAVPPIMVKTMDSMRN